MFVCRSIDHHLICSLSELITGLPLPPHKFSIQWEMREMVTRRERWCDSPVCLVTVQPSLFLLLCFPFPPLQILCWRPDHFRLTMVATQAAPALNLCQKCSLRLSASSNTPVFTVFEWNACLISVCGHWSKYMLHFPDGLHAQHVLKKLSDLFYTIHIVYYILYISTCCICIQILCGIASHSRTVCVKITQIFRSTAARHVSTT